MNQINNEPFEKTVFSSVALVGNPNCGKTALFNRLTGAHQKVANYAGVTIERKEGDLVSDAGRKFHIIDLPGIYSLSPLSLDEEVATNVLYRKNPDINLDGVIFVVDATNLRRSFRLALDVIALGYPTILALNMTDMARKGGQVIDLKLLERELGVPVVETVAVESDGAKSLLDTLESYSTSEFAKNRSARPVASDEEAKRILDLAVKKNADTYSFNRKIDSIVLHPILGLPILIAILFFMFQAVFSWAEVPMDLIDEGMEFLGEFASDMIPEGVLHDLVVDGIIAGIGSIVVFLPQILILFFFILILDESGYLPRAAFIMDRFMNRIGLSGHAFIPLLSSFACAVPGIMATRTIKNRKDRLITILVAPLMTCSARLPVYSLIIGAFIPDRTVGLFNLKGLVLFALYMAGIISAIIVAWVANRFWGKNEYKPLMMELPAYHLPRIRNIALGLWERARVFLMRVGTIIFATSVILWVLSTYPAPPEGATEAAIQYSIVGQLGYLIEPILKPIGFNWQIAIALIPAMAAREVAVSALGTIYAVAAEGDEVSGALEPILAGSWGLPTALAMLTWFVYAPQCFAMLGTIKRETNSWKTMILTMLYLFGMAYFVTMAVYHIASYFVG